MTDDTRRTRAWWLTYAVAGSALVMSTPCAQGTPAPTPLPVDVPIANAYILPGAAGLGPNAFGDEPVVIYKGEQLRWRNADGEAHNVVADTPALPEFAATGLLAPGGEQSFHMQTVGTTRIHCTIHPAMVGTLIVNHR